MPAPTVQQLKQMKQESPMWQAREQMYQKWRNIFSNEQLCKQYVGVFGARKNVIPVPEDPNERSVAQEVAQEVIDKTHSNTAQPYKHDESVQYQETVFSDAARLFLRACNSYVKTYNKTTDKTAKNLAKQGAGAYSQESVSPRSDKTIDLKQAGMAAGKRAAYLDRAGDNRGMENFEAQIDQYLANKIYSTYYLVYYLTSVAGENPEEPNTWGTKRAYQSQDEEDERINALRAVSQQYLNYEHSIDPQGSPDKNTTKYQDWVHKNNATGGR